MRGLLGIAGLGLIGVGCWLIDPTLCYIVTGSVLLTLSLAATLLVTFRNE